jgi:uncharacterized repeat protein (TIGR01451 family)
VLSLPRLRRRDSRTGSASDSTIDAIASRSQRRSRGLTRPLAALGVGLVLAMALAPTALAATPALSISTPYPAVTVGPGSSVSFDLTVKTADAQRVALAVSGVPTGWSVSLHGGGFLVDGVLTEANTAATVRLDVRVPPDAAAGTSRIVVTATAGSLSDALPIDLKVESQAGGDVTVTADFENLQGSSNSTFTFNLTVNNNTAQDLTFAANAAGPDGWTVTAAWASQAQAASAVVKSGSTSSVTVTAKAPAGAAAGKYPITVTATSGSTKVVKNLEVDVTGSYSMTLSTPNQVLSTHGTAGAEIDQQLTITNTGTAPLANVSISATPPSGWTVTFSPAPPFSSVAPNQSQTVTAKIVPSSDAIAGDYSITFSASNDQANASQDLRVTVETSILFGLIGVAAIIAVLAVLWFVFQRYGRR